MNSKNEFLTINFYDIVLVLTFNYQVFGNIIKLLFMANIAKITSSRVGVYCRRPTFLFNSSSLMLFFEI